MSLYNTARYQFYTILGNITLYDIEKYEVFLIFKDLNFVIIINIISIFANQC